MPLFRAVLLAPVCATGGWRRRTLHALLRPQVMRAFLPGHSVVAACGVPRVRLHLVDGHAVPWTDAPPAGWQRCASCLQVVPGTAGETGTAGRA